MLAPSDVAEWCELTLRDALLDNAPLLVPTAHLAEGRLTDEDVPHKTWRAALRQPAAHLVLVRRSDAETTRLVFGSDLVLLCVEGTEHCVLCEVDPDLALTAAFAAADVWEDAETTSHQVLLSAGGMIATGPSTGTRVELFEWVVDHLEQLAAGAEAHPTGGAPEADGDNPAP